MESLILAIQTAIVALKKLKNGNNFENSRGMISDIERICRDYKNCPVSRETKLPIISESLQERAVRIAHQVLNFFSEDKTANGDATEVLRRIRMALPQIKNVG